MSEGNGTGWTSLWKTNHLGRPAGEKVKSDEQLAKDLIEAGDGEPGLHPEVCDYLATKKIAMIGSDTWALEAFPPVIPGKTCSSRCTCSTASRTCDSPPTCRTTW